MIDAPGKLLGTFGDSSTIPLLLERGLPALGHARRFRLGSELFVSQVFTLFDLLPGFVKDRTKTGRIGQQ